MTVKSYAVGFLGKGFGTDNSGDETGDSVDEDEGRELTGREYILPDRNLLNIKEVDDTLIYALIVPTDNDGVFRFLCKSFECFLLEEVATRGQIDFMQRFSFF